jgi:magnesium chelatase family protein
MFTRIHSATVIGVDSSIIEIEVDLKKGLPQQTIVGLPDTAVKEAKERVHSAVRNSGFTFPLGKLTINLAPADIRKEGSIFDLGIAVGILIVSGQIETPRSIEEYVIVGELSLDGYIRPVHGVLAILETAKAIGIRKILLPSENYGEASLISGLHIHPVQFLSDAVGVISGSQCLVCADGGHCNTVDTVFQKKRAAAKKSQADSIDFSEVRGQTHAVRGVEVAASGGHNVLLIGSPGSGKTMIASRIPTILPSLTEEESVETTKIYSIAGYFPENNGLIEKRPFRAPHHTASEIAIIGGGKNPIPGEITLAHNGVLFMDEFSEFKQNIIQSLRQPMETGLISISRADFRLTFPAEFMLVASMNPCPCGYLFDPDRKCQCSYSQIRKYYMKISGPILDRIDIQIELKPLQLTEIVTETTAFTSASIKKRVMRARNIQKSRLSRYGITLNSQMNGGLTKKYCVLNRSSKNLMSRAVMEYHLSARAYFKILKLARTIADIEGRESLCEDDILEALSYREVEDILYQKPKFP